MATSRPPRRLADYAASGDILVKLPHPYETAYRVLAVKTGTNNVYQLVPVDGTTAQPLPEPLHNPSLVFSEPQHLKSSDRPNGSNNTVWGRARRSPAVTITTTATAQATPPTTAHLWLLIYAIFTIQPSEEAFRLTLSIGPDSPALSQHLINLGLVTLHPPSSPSPPPPSGAPSTPELLVLRSAFWQSAASPFGPRPIWTPESHTPVSLPPLSSYPPSPLSYTTTASSTFHPLRRAKPSPGSVVYSRWIPHLRETFSMVALDVNNAKHVDLFHTWQNDPRVSQGWDQSGSLEEHRAYLEAVQADPHQIALLARFEGVEFAYFEVYWAKVRLFSQSPALEVLTRQKTGRQNRRLLPRRRFRPRAAQSCRRRAVPRPAPRQRVVVEPDALPVPGRAADHGGRGRAQVYQQLGAHVRSDSRVRAGQVCRSAAQARGADDVLAGEVLSAVSAG